MSDKIIAELQEKGIRPSLNRIKILSYLRSTDSHPTVEDIHSRLKPELPTLSKATVYNVLRTLVAAGLVDTLNIEDTEMRYDGKTDLHGHFKCTNCARVWDFHWESSVTENLKGFTIESRQLLYKGLCPDCQAEQAKTESAD